MNLGPAEPEAALHSEDYRLSCLLRSAGGDFSGHQTDGAIEQHAGELTGLRVFRYFPAKRVRCFRVNPADPKRSAVNGRRMPVGADQEDGIRWGDGIEIP